MSHQLVPTPARPEIDAYLAQQQCSVQWRGFLHALAAEFAGALSSEDLRALMFRVGTRFAAEHPLAACTTLEDLQRSMSSVWKQIGWGWVEISQEAAQLNLQHSLSPVAAAFGLDHADWTGGFLEGVYQSWFEGAGARQLRVVLNASADAWGCVRLSLVR